MPTLEQRVERIEKRLALVPMKDSDVPAAGGGKPAPAPQAQPASSGKKEGK